MHNLYVFSQSDPGVIDPLLFSDDTGALCTLEAVKASHFSPGAGPSFSWITCPFIFYLVIIIDIVVPNR
jgi:hypothetical protein